MDLSANTLQQAITAAVCQYIDDEELYTDNVQVQINPLTAEAEIVDPDNDLDDYVYVPVMDLVKMSVENPGQWIADPDAIADIAAELSAE